jgi:hypothetical protein
MNKLLLLFLLSITFAKAQVEQGFSQSAHVSKRLEVRNENDGIPIIIFNDNIVEIVDYSEKNGSRIFEFYYNGKKYFTDQSNLSMADSTFNNMKVLTKAEREIAREHAKQFSKLCYDLEYAKAIKYYGEDKGKGAILINSLNQNSYDSSNLDFDFEFFNTSQKTVTKIQMAMVGYCDREIRSTVEAKTVTFTGNVKCGEFGHHLFRNVWKNKKLNYKDIASFKITYSDGSSEIVEEPDYFSQTYLFYAIGRTFEVDNKRIY